VDDLAEGRDSRSDPDLESPSQDRGNTSESSAPEEVREVGDLDRF